MSSEKRYSFSVKDDGDVREIITTVEGIKQNLGLWAIDRFERITPTGEEKYYFEHADHMFVAIRGLEVVDDERRDGDANK